MKKAPKKFFPEMLATGGRKNKSNLKSKAIEAKIQSEQHFSTTQGRRNRGGAGGQGPPPQVFKSALFPVAKCPFKSALFPVAKCPLPQEKGNF
jgi:hypothetical protein